MYYLMNKNEKIAKTAFEGGLHGRHLSTTSPEYGTDGSFAKCWIRLPYAVDKKELPAWGSCLKDFISYLQEKPDSRNLTYLASEKHETICCFRCGYTYKGGNVCPKCGYKMNR